MSSLYTALYKSEGIRAEEKIKEIEVDEKYKYLGVLEADSIKNKIMKKKC